MWSIQQKYHNMIVSSLSWGDTAWHDGVQCMVYVQCMVWWYMQWMAWWCMQFMVWWCAVHGMIVCAVHSVMVCADYGVMGCTVHGMMFCTVHGVMVYAVHGVMVCRAWHDGMQYMTWWCVQCMAWWCVQCMAWWCVQCMVWWCADYDIYTVYGVMVCAVQSECCLSRTKSAERHRLGNQWTLPETPRLIPCFSWIWLLHTEKPLLSFFCNFILGTCNPGELY